MSHPYFRHLRAYLSLAGALILSGCMAAMTSDEEVSRADPILSVCGGAIAQEKGVQIHLWDPRAARALVVSVSDGMSAEDYWIGYPVRRSVVEIDGQPTEVIPGYAEFETRLVARRRGQGVLVTVTQIDRIGRIDPRSHRLVEGRQFIEERERVICREGWTGAPVELIFDDGGTALLSVERRS